MTYESTLSYLYTRLPMFSRIGAAAYKADLDNTIALCHFLGNPQHQFKSVHIAGTNGKGSVSHMLAAILQTAGYKTGLYTSPHLKDFRERIRIDGKMIEEEFVVDFTEKIRPQIEAIEPSFFEITVGMAFDYFVTNNVDIAIIETGLGGRLDSTNVITPELSVITNIGWDHMNLLGNTLEKIAGEKAGIIKPGVPVVIGEHQQETLAVFTKKAEEVSAQLTVADRNWQALEWSWKNHALTISVAEPEKTDHHHYTLDLAGIYQVKNVVTVLEACRQLRLKGWHIEESHLAAALKQVKKINGLHGRWEVIHEHPAVILDVAHNEAGVRQLLEQLEVSDFHHLHIILGMVADKEVDKVLSLLPHKATYYFTKANIPRAMAEDELMRKAAIFSLKGTVFGNVRLALNAALAAAGRKDLILVCGSVFLVGEVALPL